MSTMGEKLTLRELLMLKLYNWEKNPKMGTG